MAYVQCTDVQARPTAFLDVTSRNTAKVTLCL